MLRLLFVMDPMSTVAVDKDTTFLFLTESQRRGHRNYHCLPTDLSIRDGRVFARARALEVRPIQAEHASFGATEDLSVDEFDAVLMRKDPPFDMGYVFATYLLEQIGPGTLVLNRPDSLRSANEKLYALRFPEWTPPQIVTTSRAEARAFTEAQGGKSVIKPLDGAGGEGIFLLHTDDPNFNVIVETVTGHGRRWAMVQRYIPDIRTTGDKRIVLLDGKPLGAVARIPPAGDLRGNIHVGGSVAKHVLTDRERALCDALGPVLRQDGLWFVGLDVIGDYLTEVNVTSPTGIQEINRLDGVHLESNVVDFIEAECQARRPR